MTNPPTNLTGGEAGHIAAHNHLHTGHAEFPHPPGSTSTFLRGDGTWAAPPGASGAAGFSSAFGHRYVDWAAGSDTNNGLSPATSKKTLQAAHDALPSTGGLVWAAPGQHQISAQVNWSRNNSMLIGAGRNATEFLGKTNDIHMIRLSGDYVLMSDFRIGDRSETSGINARSAIFMDGPEWPHLSRIRFDQLGKGKPAGLDWDNGPAGLRMESLQPEFGDWGVIRHCEFRSCYRGMAIAAGMNGWVQNSVVTGAVEECVKILKRDLPISESIEWRFLNCHWVGAPAAGYQVHVDWQAGALNQAGNLGFAGCVTELSAAGPGYGGYYINVQDVHFSACEFTVTDATGPTIRCGPTASEVVVGPYYAVGTPQFQVTTGNTGAMRLWQPSNFTAVPVVI